MGTLKTATRSVAIPSYEELLASLPEKFHTDKVKERLKNAWEWERKRILEDVDRLIDNNHNASARMFLFSKSGVQWIAEFWVKNVDREETNQYNWHGQNVSQWVYAGCILFDERSFESDSDYVISTHH